jgi:hypothetical protein
LISANDFLSGGGFDYAICGGFALDLFTDKNIRIHSDIDICVFEKDRNTIFSYMRKNKWNVYEFCGQGIVHLLDSINDCQNVQNFMCLKEGCELINFFPCDKGENYFLHECLYTGIKKFNYLEFMFNTKTDVDFIFSDNHSIKRKISMAILKKNNIPYLSPELVLLYKSRKVQKEEYHRMKEYQIDYNETISKMSSEQKNWFYESLDFLYPNGHIWGK